MTETVRILRLKELQKKLDAMPKKAKADIKIAIAKSAEEIVAMMRRLVPKQSGALHDSIGWGFGPPPKGAKLVASTKGGDPSLGKELTASIYAGNAKAYYAAWVEFGTAAGVFGQRVTNKSGRNRKVLRTHTGSRAHPFFFPSYRANAKRAKSRIKRAITKSAKAAAS